MEEKIKDIHDCNNCVHRNVCSYINIKQKLISNIRDYLQADVNNGAYDESDNLILDVNCKYYIKKFDDICMPNKHESKMLDVIYP